MDITLFQTLFGLAHQSKILDWIIIFFATYLSYFLLLGAVILLIFEKNWQKRFDYSSLAALSLILSRGLITEIIRFFYFRPRPFVALHIEPLINHSVSASFPSGHAAFYFALAMAVFLFNKKWGWWYLAAASMMGLARIAGGVHWPSDVIAGALIGLLSVFVVRWTLRRTFTK